MTSSSTRSVVVYGAYGHTGRFIVAELMAKGVAPVLVGRNPERLAAYRPESPDGPELERRVAVIDSGEDLERAFAGAAVVINAAGPYLDTGLPVARAALAVGAHYLDLAAEQAAVHAIHDQLDRPARDAAVTLVPAMAFYGGLADLLATRALADNRHAHRVDVAVWLDRWWPTEGTRVTGERNTVPRQVVRDGRLTELGEPGSGSWTFAPPVGTQPMVEVPFSEVVTIARHLPVRELRSHLSAGALHDVRDGSTPPPEASEASGRSTQSWVMEVEVETDSGARRVGASGRDIYATSAPLVVAATTRLLAGESRTSGAVAPAQAFDATGLLGALEAEGALALHG